MEPTCQPWSIPVSSTFVGRAALLYGQACPCTNFTAKPGEIYFLVRMVAGGGYDELTPTEVSPDEGKKLVAKAKLSESHPK